MDAKTIFYQLMYMLGTQIEDQGISILCYHSIDDSGSRISLSPERFAAHMRLLHELGYRTIHISDVLTHLLHGIPLKRKVVAITFDDGFENLYSCAMPIMQRYGYEGYPVVENGRVIGLLNRRAVDRAVSHQLNIPARAVMEAGCVTVHPADSIERLQQIMSDSGWGQIPVLDPGTEEIVGIVTRTDLIKTLTAQPAIPGRLNFADRL